MNTRDESRSPGNRADAHSADTVGLRYETGDFSAYETIAFRRIPVARLAEPVPCPPRT